jgi:OOP family OmpA-OmpF porin
MAAHTMRLEQHMRTQNLLIIPAITAAFCLATQSANADHQFSHITGTHITGQVDAVRKTRPSGSPFTAALQQEYLWLADAEYGAGDLSDTLSYAGLGGRAAAGEDVMPADPEAWGLNAESALTLDDAKEAEASLVALFAAGGKAKAPVSTGRAQVAFDCMVRESCPLETHPAVAGCRDRFWNAIRDANALMKPKAMAQPAPEPEPAPKPVAAPPALDYLVYFDFDSSDIRADSAAILDRVSGVIKDFDMSRVSLVGHADRAGASTYNQRLSERRAQSVRAYLEALGISSSLIAATGLGEDDPRLPTPDGVREQENRRVEIRLRQKN